MWGTLLHRISCTGTNVSISKNVNLNYYEPKLSRIQIGSRIRIIMGSWILTENQTKVLDQPNGYPINTIVGHS